VSGIGPILLFDKSALDEFRLVRCLLLSEHYSAVLCRDLAGLGKEVAEGKTVF